jgi:hypothetical protein
VNSTPNWNIRPQRIALRDRPGPLAAWGIRGGQHCITAGEGKRVDSARHTGGPRKNRGRDELFALAEPTAVRDPLRSPRRL